MDFSDHLNGPAKWELGPSKIVTLKMDGGSTVLLLNGNQAMLRLNAPEYVDGAVVSEDGKTLVLTVMKSSGGGAGFARRVFRT